MGSGNRSQVKSIFYHVFILPLAICAACKAEAQTVTVDEVLSAWKEHSASIQSLQYECEYQRTEPINKMGSNDLFGEGANAVKEPVTLHGDLTFSIAGERIGCLRVAQFWDDEAGGLTIRTQRHLFDGKQNHDFYGGREPIGVIENAKTPSSSVTNHVELRALWLSYSPLEFLKQYKIPLAELQVAEEELTFDGSPCLAISSQAGPNHEMRFLLHVADTPDHRPLRWSMSYKGMPRRLITLRYDAAANDEWALSGYSTTTFHQKGGVSLAIEGVVKNRRVNEILDEAVFTIDYPEGTRVMQNGAGFIQEAGKLRPADGEGTRPE
jgi:hypothetical protein